MKSDSKKSLHNRAIVSIGLFVLFLLLPISGIMVDDGPDNSGEWSIWGGIHATLGLLFAVFGTFHIVYNWKLLKNYLRGGRR